MRDRLTTEHSNEWQQFELRLKKIILLAGGCLGLCLALLSTELFCLSIGSGLIICYTLFPRQTEKWLNTHQLLLAGGVLGFIYAGGLGLILGAWFANALNRKYQQAVDQANRITQSIYHPLSTLTTVAVQKLGVLKEKVKVLFQAADAFLLEEIECHEEDDDKSDAHFSLLPSSFFEIVSNIQNSAFSHQTDLPLLEESDSSDDDLYHTESLVPVFETLFLEALNQRQSNPDPLPKKALKR